MQGGQARYGAELPPFISIVQCPGRPVILGMDFGGNQTGGNLGPETVSKGKVGEGTKREKERATTG